MLLLFLTVSVFATAQSPAPGGVKTPKVWYSAILTPEGELVWKDQLSGKSTGFQPNAPEYLLNFNPSYTFDRNSSGLKLEVPGLKTDRWTLFTVFHPQDNFSEKSIWSFQQNGQTKGMLTTHRMADLERFEYLNFPGTPDASPKVSTYLHHRAVPESDPSPYATLLLGQKPRDRDLPITGFQGKIPEIILYERVLSPVERQRVESYLAIKYGTNLDTTQRVNYLNASGESIFTFTEARDYTHRITGIGRDDLSGLHQKQSTSSYNPGLLHIGLGSVTEHNSANRENLPDQHFMLWSDNNAPLENGLPQMLQTALLQRRWLVQTTGDWSDLSTEVQFDTHRLRTTAAAGATYWLIVDRSGREDFSGPRDYYPISRLRPDGTALFTNIHWDPDGSGQDIFTLATGPELLVQAQIRPPQCAPETAGSLHLRAVGGRPPYQFQLHRDNRLIVGWTSPRNEEKIIEDLPAGQYQLVLTDADGREYQEGFYFQSIDAPVISLADRYQLVTAQPLMLDATLTGSTGLDYEWQLPDGSRRHSAQLRITEAGTYTISAERDGCVAQKSIQIAPPPQGNFRRVDLFPNPSSDGHFRARIHLETSADLRLKIFDPGGKLIQERSLSGSNYYHTDGRLSGKGSYLIQFRSQNDQLTIPFIVQ